jgi:inorganic pyrophosphatase
MKLAYAAALSFLTVPAIAAPNVLSSKQPSAFPDEITMVVEIPAGGSVKYETDTDTGQLFVDRFLSMPMAYPANYGSITRTKAADGDPLDVLVFTRQPVQPGATMRVRPIGLLKMIDGGDIDDKVIAVPVTKLDPTYGAIAKIEDLPAAEQDRLQAFFRVYKQLPAGSKVVEVKGFDTPEAAKAMIKAAGEQFKD